MTIPPPKICKRIAGLLAMMGSDKAPERETARSKLDSLLRKHGCGWNDIPGILAAVHANDAPSPDPADQSADPSADPPAVNVYNLVHELVRRHIYVTPHECTAIALWILHCWVFRRFTVSPRLALLSPVRGCGKTTTLALIEQLVPESWRTDDISPASIYRQRRLPIFLLDEFDQAGLRTNRTLKSVLHGGWRVGGSVSRYIKNFAEKFNIYAPVALAAIGAQSLSLPLLDRSIAIHMHKPPRDVELERLNELCPSFLATRKLIAQWARATQLNLTPDTADLSHRQADNWRVLFAVADSLSASTEARAAALTLQATRPDVDPGVALLYDVRLIFQQQAIDRITSVDLVAALHELSDFWLDWDDDRPGRKLTQTHVARLLGAFAIRSKVIWPTHRGPTSKSRRGYMRDQFQDAWRRYCSDDDVTASQRKKSMRLVGS